MLWLGQPNVHVTWEPASSLPVAAIEEFEKGFMSQVVQHKSDQYGRTWCKYHCRSGKYLQVTTSQEISDRPSRCWEYHWVSLLNYALNIMQQTHYMYDTCSALVEDTPTTLTCNTEKDKHIRLNLRTAGIMYNYVCCLCTLYSWSKFNWKCSIYGMHPYGVIVLLNKLHTTESITQVYGSLHNYYALHPVSAQDIGMIILFSE